MVAYRTRCSVVFAALALGLLAGCDRAWNDPYPVASPDERTIYAAFSERPKHLDPVQSYSENEATFNSQIYEPPLQYHFLKRPYELIPLAAREIPQPTYLDATGRTLPVDAPAQQIKYSVYEIRLRTDLRYQPHPALARDSAGHLRYLALTPEQTDGVYRLADFPERGSRAVRAEDFVYQIKRLAHPRLHSPIIELMAGYIVGLKELSEQLREENKRLIASGRKDEWLDLRKFPLSGVEVVDDHTYRVKVHGKYPQFAYWLAMNFFAPIPVEADQFYSQPGLIKRDITLDWFPIGSGPYMLTENNPNARMVLERNPNYHGETYPDAGETGDREAGLLNDAGAPLPFIDRVVFSRERESIPYWNKFLQGYYDTSGIASDNFDQAVQMNVQGEAQLTQEMAGKGVRLEASVSTSTIYMAFNMLDPVVGGRSEKNRKLRQAISIAVDYEEFISIFANGRGIPAQGPIAPGIFGYRDGKEGINPVVYEWSNDRPKRRSIEHARRLLAEAGYPNGRDATTGKPLVLNFDVTSRSVEDKPRFDWYRRQFAKLAIQLEVRATDYNRFQEKVRTGNAQILTWGWNADYPDPENFLFLLHGPQSKVSAQGENAANYANAEFDRLFEEMKHMPNSDRRQAIIDQMITILREDAPWLWGIHPKSFGLYHEWIGNVKPNQMARNNLKYQRVDAARRAIQRRDWNEPILFPMLLAGALAVLFVVPAVLAYRRRERMSAR